MKAIVYDRYGPPDVLQLKELQEPVPASREVLVRIHATTVTSGDVRIRSFRNIPAIYWLPGRLYFGVFKPRRRILGSDFAGQVVSIGKKVTAFKAGDQVFGSHMSGAYAEYMCLPENAAITTKPTDLSYEEAAAVPFGASNALFFLRKANVRKGQKVLVNGASGAVGTAAIQLAKFFGAEVTGVCSTANLRLVRSLGADHVIDYTQEDFTRSGQCFDVIFDTVGTIPFARCRNSLNPSGVYVATVFGIGGLLQMLWTSQVGSKKVICAIAEAKKEDLVFIRKLLEAGDLRPVIDRGYPLEELPEAHRYVEKGHKKGAVVITLPA